MKWYFFSVLIFESKTKRKTFQSAFQAKVVKSAINISWSTPWSEKSHRLHPSWSGNSRRLRRGLESRAVSTLVAKVAPYPSLSRGIVSWSRRLYPWALKAAPYSLWPVPFPFWLLQSRCIHDNCEDLYPGHRLDLGLEKRDVSFFIWKVAPWSRKSRQRHSDRETPAASTTVAKNWFMVVPSPPRFGSSLGLHLGRQSLNYSFWSGWPGRSRRCFLSRAISWVAPNPPWSWK